MSPAKRFMDSSSTVLALITAITLPPSSKLHSNDLVLKQSTITFIYQRAQFGPAPNPPRFRKIGTNIYILKWDYFLRVRIDNSSSLMQRRQQQQRQQK